MAKKAGQKSPVEMIREYLVLGLSVLLCFFHLYTGFFGIYYALLQRILHLFMILILVFLMFPSKKGAKKNIKILDLVFFGGIIYSMGYLWINFEYLSQVRIPVVEPVTPSQVVGATILIVSVLEAVRRVLGKGLVIVSLVFLLYYLIGPYLPRDIGYKALPFGRFVDGMYLTTKGIFGMPLGLSSTYIALFIIFGSFLSQSGFGNFIINFVTALTGRYRGGPAKVAVVSSALFGSISGSGTANAMTTGTFTIPLMKRIGYKPYFAGAVEAVASTGGQIMPPIMGAGAFLMAEFTGIPYIMIVKHALIPAILYFAGIFFVVDLEASRLNLNGLEKKDMPEWKSKILTYGHMTIPLIVLVYLLVQGRTPNFAVTRGIATMFLLSLLRSETRLNLEKLIAGTREATKGLVLVGTACAAAGIIIGVVGITGVSVKFSYIVIMLSRESYLLALFLTMIAAIILGMGMPTSAAYVLMASMLIPALTRLDIGLIEAHLFGFYFACISLVTPPVAVTSYACAGLAGADFHKTGWTALKMALPAFVVPYFFIFSPELLLMGSVVDTIIAIPTALLGIYSMSVALQGFWRRKLTLWLRAIILFLSLLLIFPGIYSDLIAVVSLVFLAVNIKSTSSLAARSELKKRDL